MLWQEEVQSLPTDPRTKLQQRLALSALLLWNHLTDAYCIYLCPRQ